MAGCTSRLMVASTRARVTSLVSSTAATLDTRPGREKPSGMRRLTVAVAAAAALLCLAAMVVRQPARSSEPPRPTDPNRWAVLVGVDHFEGRTHSNVGAVGDAHLFAKVLTERGWDPKHIVLLTDGDATQANIRAAFAWLAQHATD